MFLHPQQRQLQLQQQLQTVAATAAAAATVTVREAHRRRPLIPLRHLRRLLHHRLVQDRIVRA